MSLAAAIARHPGRVILATLLVGAAALWPASRFRLRTDLTELLPHDSRAAADYRHYLERFGGIAKVFVVVLASGEAPAPLLEAAERLAARLEASPLVAEARTGVEPEDEEFFLRYVVARAPLHLGEGWRETVASRLEPEAIRRRVARLREGLATALAPAERPLRLADPLGFSDELPALRAAASGLPLDPLTSMFSSPEGDAALVVVTPSSAEIDPAGGRALQAALEAAYEAVRRELGDARAVEFRAVGGPLYAAHDEAILRQDLERTLTGSLLGCALLLLAAFGGPLVPGASLAALAVALVWTAALVALVTGGVSGVGIGFGAVLVGLGIDYGIHGGARFREFLTAGAGAGGALEQTFRHTGPGILTSALTTAAAFTVLAGARLPALRELGGLVALGILCVLLATATLGAALLTLARPGGGGRGGWLWSALDRVVRAATGLARTRPRACLAAALAASLALAPGLARLTLDADLRSVRPLDHPAHEVERLVAERFGLGLETATATVRGADLAEALEKSRLAERWLASRLGAEAEVTGPARWLAPASQVAERLAAFRDLPFARAAELLQEELRRAGLDPTAFGGALDALRAFGRGEDPGAPPPEAWPGWLAALVRGGPGGAWAAIDLRLPGGSGAGPPGDPIPAELADELRRQIPGSGLAAAALVGAELRTLARRDLRRLSLLALGAVAVVVLVSFRGRPARALLACAPAALGSLWALGLWGLLGRPLDLVTLAVLPILLGIGIDDGLHVLHGARLEPATGLHGAAKGAGRAMALTTLTTCVGFGSLTLSRVPGLVSGGLLISTGVAACLLATLVVLPALERVLPGGGRVA